MKNKTTLILSSRTYSRWLCVCLWMLALSVGTPLWAQESTRTVTGKVVDAANDPLVGVTVVVKGRPTVGTSTDASGQFSLSVSPADVLVFSYVGYTPREIRVGEQSTLAVTLTNNTQSLDELIVIGYGTTTRQDITTAVAKVDPKKVPAAANQSVPELLFGRAAGVQVNQVSSQPGGNINVSIRGKGNPLIVVDGVVFPNSGLEPRNGSVELQGVNRGPLANLNPSDIESIELLKDASASIYGVSAADGVMLITTKKGKAGRMNVSYDASRSVVQNMPYLETLNAHEYMTYHNQLSQDRFLNDKQMAPFGPNPANLGTYIPRFTESQIQEAGEGVDWLDQVLRTGSIDNHVLSVNGGTERFIYYFSGSFFNQKGTVQNSDLRRYTGRMNMSFNLNKYIRLNTSVSANRNDYTNPQAGQQSGGSGNQGFNALQAALAYPGYIPIRTEIGEFSQFGVTGNPLSLLQIRDQTQSAGLFATASVDIDFIPEVLTGRLSYGNNTENALRDFYIPSDVFYSQVYRSRASLADSRRENETMEGTLSFNKRLADVLRVDAVVGVGRYLDRNRGMTVETFDVLDAINTDRLETATGPRNIWSYRGVTEFRSIFARSTFDFLDRYLLTLSLRRDGADRFFPNNKYQNFPAASVGWKISNESFLQGVDFLSLLKLRASYGLTGNRPGDAAYGVFSPDNVAITFNNGSEAYLPYRLTQFDNPNLQWPLQKTANVGFDFGLFQDRISGTLDVFTEDRTRLLTNAPTAALSFIGTAPVNGGHQRRRGIELGLNTSNVETVNFTWNTIFNITHFENRWVERFPNTSLNPWENVDDPLGTIYVYGTEGIIQVGQDVPAWQPQNAHKPGSPLFVDQNGDGALNHEDVARYSGIPKAVIGFGNEFRVKNFDLNIFLYGQFGAWGNDFTTQWGDPLGLLSDLQNASVRIRDVWSTTNPSGSVPGVAFNASTLALAPGTDYILAKRDFVRARNITLGYTFSSPAVQQFVGSLRVFADVQNAFVLTGFKGIDPEIQIASTKGGSAPYPMARTFSLGLRANF